MKKSILLIMIVAFAATTTFAQASSDPKGPKAKNQKPWEKNRTDTEVLVNSKPNELKGPPAKNKNVWQEDTAANKKTIKTKKNKSKLKGPKAKNAKAWE